MHVALWVWALTVAGLLLVLGVDLFLVDRRPHVLGLREAALWVAATVCASLAFGLGLTLVAGGTAGGQFFAGWITEYSLSLDNLFVFVVIMARFAVPEAAQHRALLVGIMVALLLRAAFIAAGAALVSSFSWVFYLFGAFLIYTAVKLARQRELDRPDERENPLVRLARRVLPVTDSYEGVRLVVRSDGRRLATPMLIVVIAIGSADLMFALDSIPAIFGLTHDPYLVFTANLFALLGLRQLYFLIGGLLRRLVYLSLGLSVILAFIGVKMITEALLGSGIEHLGPVPVPHIGTVLSLAVIVCVLAATTAVSLVTSRRQR